jgi:hypothetical protein
MEELGLTYVRSSFREFWRRGGISGGERMKVAVARTIVRVVAPSCPGSSQPGLTQPQPGAAGNTARLLADMGHSVAIVIHQPGRPFTT